MLTPGDLVSRDGAAGGRRYSGPMPAEQITIPIPGAEPVSGLWQAPVQPKACLVLAHGAGAGMTHRSMAATADGLSDLGVATLRYQFPTWSAAAGGSTPPPP